jgi:acetyltransferase-like isoleucine patch superfamily enzyme
MIKRAWRKLNKLFLYIFKGINYVYGQYNTAEARRIGVKVGENCRFISTVAATFSTEPWLIEIGDHVSMTNPLFITHDGGIWVFRNQYPEIELFGKIKIGNNVFIGSEALILLNTEIGDNSIIAARAVVKGTFEPNSVLAGVPARRICSVDEYFEKNKDRFLWNARNLPSGKKRSIICEKLDI